MYTQLYQGMKDSTNAKGIFYFIFQKRHTLAGADILKGISAVGAS